VVDARQYQVGTALSEEGVHRELHAVHRCAVDRPHLSALFVGPAGNIQFAVHRYGRRLTRSGAVGSHRHHIGPAADAFGQIPDACGLEAVVVGYEYECALIHLFSVSDDKVTKYPPILFNFVAPQSARCG
jgi:hypothetical protein